MGMTGSGIVQAIRQRRMLTLQLGGSWLCVEPHAYGIDYAGRPVLVCYQWPGSATSAGEAGWRDVRLLEVRLVVDCRQCFAGPRSGYVRNNPAFHTIFAQICVVWLGQVTARRRTSCPSARVFTHARQRAWLQMGSHQSRENCFPENSTVTRLPSILPMPGEFIGIPGAATPLTAGCAISFFTAAAGT